MPRRKSPTKSVGPDWFLPEWMAYFKVTSAHICRETGWSKATMSDIVNGRTEYYRAILNEVARVLKVAPYELLMPPEEAMRIKRLMAAVDEEARLKVAEGQQEFRAGEPPDTLKRAG